MRLYFLKKCKSPLIVYYAFILTKIKKFCFKRKIKIEKKKHKNFLKSKKISHDFFSSHAYNFFKILNNFQNEFNYLEIGSYEGNSAMFVANTFPKSKVNCVDTWIKTDEYEKEINFTEIEENFNFNISSYDNIKKFKKSSDNFFEQNKKIYEVIYVDGYHFGKQVYKDIKNAWKFLSNEGYLICDDYIWNISTKNIETTPCYAINKFLMEIKNCYKIIFVSNSQICLKKRM